MTPRQSFTPEYTLTETRIPLAPIPSGDTSLGLVGVTRLVETTKTGWKTTLSDAERKAPVTFLIYPVFTAGDPLLIYFIEIARFRVPGGSWQPIPRGLDGLLVLPPLPVGDELGYELQLEAAPQGGAAKKRQVSGGLTARPEGGGE